MRFQRLALEGLNEWEILEQRIRSAIDSHKENALSASSIDEVKYCRGAVDALLYVLDLPSMIEKELENASHKERE